MRTYPSYIPQTRGSQRLWQVFLRGIVGLLLFVVLFVHVPPAFASGALSFTATVTPTTLETGETIDYILNFSCGGVTGGCGDLSIPFYFDPALFEVVLSEGQIWELSDGFTGDVSNIATGEITISKSPFNDGDAGQAIIRLRARSTLIEAYLVPGISITATITTPASPPGDVTVNTPDITIEEPTLQWSVNKVVSVPSGTSPAPNNGSNGAYVRYDVQYCSLSSTGNLPVNGAVLIDELPNDGTNVLVENVVVSGGGERFSFDGTNWIPDPNGIYVRWILSPDTPGDPSDDLTADVGCVTRTVQYEFPTSAGFAVGSDGTTTPATTNFARGYYDGIPDDPGVCVDPCIGEDDDSPTLAPPSGEPNPFKSISDARPVAYPGVASFYLGFDTENLNVSMSDVMIIDIIPLESGRPAVDVYEVFSGTWDTTLPAAELRIVFEDGTIHTHSVDGSGQTFNFGTPTVYNAPRADGPLPAGNLITQVSLTFPEVPMEFSFGNAARLDFTARSDSTGTMVLSNCATMFYDDTVNPPATGGFNEDCAIVTTTDEPDSSVINWEKGVSSGPINNEDIITFSLSLEYTDQSSGNLPPTFIYTDTLHPVLDFVNLAEVYPNPPPLSGQLFEFITTGLVVTDDVPAPYLRVEFDTPGADETTLTFIWTSDPATDLTGGNVYDINGSLIDPNTAPSNAITASAPLPGSQKVLTINFKARVKSVDEGGRAGSYGNEVLLTASAPELLCDGEVAFSDTCSTSVGFAVREVAEISAFKWVQSEIDPTNHVRPDRASYTTTFTQNSFFQCSSPVGSDIVLRSGYGLNPPDPDYSRSPCAAQGNPGEDFNYLYEITNDGNIDLNEFILYDILPYIGDMGISQATQSQARGSQFIVWLRGVPNPVRVIEPAGFDAAVTIQYSQSSNPCRPEMSSSDDESGWQASCDNDWTSNPASWGANWQQLVRSFRVVQTNNGYVVPPSGTIRIEVDAYIPTHDEVSGDDRAFTAQTAWNNYAYRFTSQSTGNRLLTAEPRRVGIRIPERLSVGNRVWIDDGGNVNESEADNRVRDAIEEGVDGVVMRLYRWDGDPSAPLPDINNADPSTIPGVVLIAETTTGYDGYYLFEIDQRARGDFGGAPEAPYDWIDGNPVYSLRPGHYFVFVPTENFDDPADPLYNYISSTGLTDSANTSDDLDRGVDEGVGSVVDPPVNGVVSEWFTLRFGQSPLGEGDVYAPNDLTTDPFGPDGYGTLFQNDAYSDLIRDFGFIKPMALGNRIWIDDGGEAAELAGTGVFNAAQKNDGIFNGDEAFVDGVTVELYRDVNGNGTIQVGNPADRVATTTTQNDGYYLFPGLAPGDYIVHIPAANFAPGGVLYHHVSSTGWTTQQTDGTPVANFVDTNPDGSGTVITDNGIDNANPSTNGISSAIIQLRRDQETVAEVDFEPGTNPDQSGGYVGNQIVENQNNDLTIDFAFVKPPMSVGNYVWHDNGLVNAGDGSINYSQFNDGIRNGDEPGIAEVRVNLYRDDDGDGVPDGPMIGWTTTDANGYYLFDRYMTDGWNILTGDPANARDLPPGGYVVEIDASNFEPGAPLEFYLSSDDPASANTPGVDNDDNGIGDINDAPYAGGIFSRSITLTPHSAPVNEPDDGATPANHGTSVTEYGVSADGTQTTTSTAIADNMSDRTWDFGLYKPMSIGNLIWLDMDDITGEPGDGIFQLGETGIDGVTVALYVDNAGTGVISGSPILTTTTANGGYYLFDQLPAGRYIVHIPASEFQFGATSLDDGPLALYISSIGTVATGYQATTPTDENGAAYGNPAIEDDGTDHGIDPAPGDQRVNGVSSATITLTLDGEPDFETDKDTALAPYPDGNRVLPENSDLTVDFGFWSESIPGVTTFSLGNFIWEDANNNGIYDTGETRIEGVTVNLYRDDNADGLPDDVPIATTTTDVDGFYLFDDLIAGRYLVQITPENWDVGADGLYGTADDAVLVGYISSTPDATGDTITDTVLDGVVAENGIDQTDINNNGTSRDEYETNGIFSTTILLQPQGAPTGESTDDVNPDDSGIAADNNSNLTIDFGVFRPMSIGNRVWLDDGNVGATNADLTQFDDGIRNGTETGIDGVTVELYLASDLSTPIATTITANGGYYLFDGLIPGDYVVAIPASNFIAPGDPLYGLMSSTGDYVNPNNDTSLDNHDNGIDALDPGADGVWSSTITLTLEAMPTFGAGGTEDDRYNAGSPPPYGPDGWGRNGELDENSNITVDFGFVPWMSLGNLIWIDDGRTGVDQYDPTLADNGLRDPNELGVVSVQVNLYFASDLSTVIGTAWTDADGYYLFEYLPPGAYVVEVDAGNFAVGQPLHGYFSSTPTTAPDNIAANNDDDHGINNSDPATNGIRTGTITLTLNTAPITEDPDNSTTHTDADRPILDRNSNLTIDLGFIRPMAIGNRVWEDNERTLPTTPGDGLRQSTEPGIDGVTVELYLEGQTPGVDTPLASTETADGGYYLFDRLGSDQTDPNAPRLGPGNYVVYIPASNFTGTGALVGFINSDNGEANTSGGDNGVDSTVAAGDENGIDADPNNNATYPAVAGTSSTVIRLRVDSEPTGEGDFHTPGYHGEGVLNEDSDFTIDFAFYTPPLSIGNFIWIDDGWTGTTFDPTFFGDGIFNASELPVPDGVTVHLYEADALDNPGTLIATTTTDNGYYLFDGLEPGRYIVGVAADNFQSSGLLYGFSSSVGNYSDPTTVVPNGPNTRDDSRDNGIDDVDSATNGIFSHAFDLDLFSEPMNESDFSGNPADGPDFIGNFGEQNHNSNMTIDFGFMPYMSLGNRVWLDDGSGGGVFNDGIQNGTEPGIAGVTVWLYTADAVGNLGAFVATTTTDANGHYLFGGLPPGEYIVVIPPENFQSGGVLQNYDSSYDATGERLSTDPNDFTPALAADRNDNGIDNELPADAATGGVRSRVVVLSYDDELTGETDLGDDALVSEYGPDGRGIHNEADANSDLAIDFGFVVPKYSLGNVLWYDFDNDGVYQTGTETPVSGATVRLYRDDNLDGIPDTAVSAPLRTTTTNADGFYLFDNLDAGSYVIWIDAQNFRSGEPLFNFLSSTGDYNDPIPGTAPGNTRDELRDNGIDNLNPSVNGIYSGTITLSKNSLPMDEAWLSTNPAHGPDGERRGNYGQLDSNSDLTRDFGFYKPMSIGNRVWFDINANGIIDPGEGGISGVTVLLIDGSDGMTVLETTITDLNGYYLFDNLAPGDYIVRIPDSNFAGPLNGLRSTVDDIDPGTGNPIVNPTLITRTDNNDNGIGTTDSGDIDSVVITLVWDSEPTNESDIGPQGVGSNGETNANSNLTIDFGFTGSLMSLGNRVWFDPNNNGIEDAAEANNGITGVVVSLYRDTNADGLPDGPAIATTTTDANGYYLFDGLAPGNYLVGINNSNFNTGSPLAGLRSSTDQSPPVDPETSQTDADDNGLDTINASYGILTSTIVLASGTEPLNETTSGNPAHGTDGRGNFGETDDSSDLTIDFGFYRPMSIGNRVWFDLDESGHINGTEGGASGVTLSLYYANPDGTPDLTRPVPNPTDPSQPYTTTTDSNGYYLFDGLGEGDYVVVVDGSNFDAGGPLFGMRNSEGPNANTNFGVDNNNNGITPADYVTEGIASNPVILTLNTMPTSELAANLSGNPEHGPQFRGRFGELNNNSDLTIDFGVVPAGMSLGNRVWFDTGANFGNGQQEADESGAGGVRVNLYRDTNGDGIPDGAPIATTTTDANGYYLFQNLTPGSYLVQLDPWNFQAGRPLEGYGSTLYDENEVGNDQYNNGLPGGAPSLNGIYSDTVTLVNNSAPTGETDLGPDGNGTGIDDANANLTVDFGVVRYLSIGNRVWRDTGGDTLTNNGLHDAAENNNGIADVELQLFYEDPLNPGQIGDFVPNPYNPADPYIVTTDANGYYLFDRLLEGNYIVVVLENNFTGTAALVGMTNSTPTNPDPLTGETTTDRNDNGINTAVPEGIRSNVIPMTYGAQPTNETDISGNALLHGPNGRGRNGESNANSNLTIDFGFFYDDSVYLSIGNRVWFDTGDGAGGVANDGIQNGDEPGVDGVTVHLYASDASGNLIGSPLQTVQTEQGGYYLFDNLPPGYYVVILPASNFTSGQPLYGYLSSTGAYTDPTTLGTPNTRDDERDNGVDVLNPAVNGVRSGIVQLVIGGAPEGETSNNSPLGIGANDVDENSNQTIDFGFVIRYDLGDAPETGAGAGGYTFTNGNDANYGTTYAENGPSHRIIPNLYMGGRVDAEDDGQPSVNADGDDLTGVPDDEDGVTIPPLVADSPADVVVVVFNNTGQTAYLVGWIDFDGSGTFDDSEAVWVEVPSSASPQNITLPFYVPLGSDLPDSTDGTSYARFRLTTDPSLFDNGDPNTGTPQPGGEANDGEVEDYLVQVEVPGISMTKTDGVDVIVVGQATTYTVTIRNSGSGTAVFGRNFTDDLTSIGFLPDSITWTCVANTQATCISGQPFGTGASDANGNLNEVIDLNPAGEIIYTITGTLDPAYLSPPSTVTNEAFFLPNSAIDVNGVLFEPPPGTKVGQVLGNNVIRWVMSWANNGEAQTATVTDALPTNQSFNGNLVCTAFGTSITTSCDYNPIAHAVTWSGTIAQGNANRVEIAFEVVVPGPGTYQNTASLTTELPGDTTSIQDSVTIPGVPIDDDDDDDDDDGEDPEGGFVVSDPAISKVGAPQFAQPGEEVVWTITITNPGSTPALNPVVTDVIPSELEVLSASASSGTLTWDGAVYTWTQPELAPGKEVTITIITRVRMDAEVPFTVTNTAVLTSDNFDEVTSSANVISAWELPATGAPPLRVRILHTVLAVCCLLVMGAGVFRMLRRLVVDHRWG